MYDKTLMQEMYNMYIESQIGSNEICKKCKAFAKSKGKELVNGPLPLFHIGKDFAKSKKRLVLVGLVAYGWTDYVPDWSKLSNNPSDIFTYQNKISERYFQLIDEKAVRITSYINSALKSLYGSIAEGYNKVAITNYIHCNPGTATKDIIPQKVKDYCAHEHENNLIRKELEILKPTHVIGFTKNWSYDRYLNECKRELMPEYIKPSWKYKGIDHPSKRGNSVEKFTGELVVFLET